MKESWSTSRQKRSAWEFDWEGIGRDGDITYGCLWGECSMGWGRNRVRGIAIEEDQQEEDMGTGYIRSK